MSFKQKKQRTLATRKRSRKRKIDQGLTLEDESGRLFAPPHLREPRWKKKDLESEVQDILAETVAPSETSLKKREKRKAEKERAIIMLYMQYDPQVKRPTKVENFEASFESDVNETFGSAEESLKAVAKLYKEIRKKDGRNKAKVVILVENEASMKQLPAMWGETKSKIKKKSKLGIGSDNSKPTVEYRTLKLLSEDCKEGERKRALRDLSSGKVSAIISNELDVEYWKGIKPQYLFVVSKVDQEQNSDRETP